MWKSINWLVIAALMSIGSGADGTSSNPSDEVSTLQQARPYDETVDAGKAINAALIKAKSVNKLLLITFGANWCPDCRALDRAITAPEIREVLDSHFVSVKVDVGDWDKNLELIASWGKPTSGGIPTVVVATAAREILYTTRAGQLSKARDMGPEAFARFFEYIAGFRP